MRERRRDARVTPAGRVSLALPPPKSATRGRLVDVGAGGLRLDLGEGRLAAGTAVAVEIHLESAAHPQGPAQLVLDGKGRVVWTRAFAGRCHAGVQFDQPVTVRPTFPDLTVY